MAKKIWRPRSQRMTREEYLSRAKEFAHRPKGKLTEEQRQAIRENRRGLTLDQLAEEYGCHRNTVHKWRHAVG